jgi:hypothetical protein
VHVARVTDMGFGKKIKSEWSEEKTKADRAGGMTKDWDAVARALSSPDSSDAEDTPNLESFKKNAARAVELLHSFMPGLDPRFAGATPKGMNRPDEWRAGLANAAAQRPGKRTPRPAAPPPAPPLPPETAVPPEGPSEDASPQEALPQEALPQEASPEEALPQEASGETEA